VASTAGGTVMLTNVPGGSGKRKAYVPRCALAAPNTHTQHVDPLPEAVCKSVCLSVCLCVCVSMWTRLAHAVRASCVGVCRQGEAVSAPGAPGTQPPQKKRSRTNPLAALEVRPAHAPSNSICIHMQMERERSRVYVCMCVCLRAYTCACVCGVAQTLPIYKGKPPCPPLCGPTPPARDYVMQRGDVVAARPSKARDGLQEWMLATVVRYYPGRQRYEVEDVVEEDDGDDGEAAGTRKKYAVAADAIIPMPKSLPDPSKQVRRPHTHADMLRSPRVGGCSAPVCMLCVGMQVYVPACSCAYACGDWLRV
jgi:hypothetical protein